VGPCGSVRSSRLPFQPRTWYLAVASLLPHLNFSLHSSKPIAPDSQSFVQLDSRLPLAAYQQLSFIINTSSPPHNTTAKMRFSTSAVFAAVAIGAQALPQTAQPITQISDGQIQVSFAQLLHVFVCNANAP